MQKEGREREAEEERWNEKGRETERKGKSEST